MIYKILYQETADEPAVRERTKTLYMDADSVREVRALLREHTPYLIENIFPLDEAHLAYEKQSANFKLTEFDD